MKFRDSSDLPSAGPESKVFRAWGPWGRNVRVFPVGTTVIAIFLLLMGGVLIKLTEAVPWQAVLLILAGIAVPLALFPGKVGALYPYAVQVELGRGFRFYSGLGNVFVPVEEVRKIRWSWLYGGWVITLTRRYGLLRGFLIHFAWGNQGRELAHAIEEELARKT